MSAKKLHRTLAMSGKEPKHLSFARGGEESCPSLRFEKLYFQFNKRSTSTSAYVLILLKAIQGPAEIQCQLVQYI